MARPLPLLVALLALLALSPAAAQAFRLGEVLGPIAGNPAERLAGVPIEDAHYEPATRCSRAARPGMARFSRWLAANAAGTSWGTYRCERWGERQASLHAEGRAIDWHLDSRVPAQRAAGKKLIRLLLAPDSAGQPHALARRMGVEELIWDCSYWSAGSEDFRPYAPCFNAHGERRRRVNPTVGHMDHLHIGMTKDGAMGRTSFWRR